MWNCLEICQRSLTVVSPESCRVVIYVKYSEDSERMKRKSPFSTTPLSFDALSPANPREYLHKPYTARNYVPWATYFVADSIWVALQIFEQYCRKPETPAHKLPSPKQILTQNGHSRSFNVIYLGIIEKPLMGYIVQYNKCGLRCEGWEDISSERSENLHFRPLHSHLTPDLQRNPVNIPIWLT